MTTIDPFGATDTLDEATLETLVTRFEARGQHPHFARMLREYLDAMRIDEATSVLDLGCGTGLVARTIAGRVGFSGRAVGVDISSYLVSAATRLARDDGVDGRTEFASAGFQEGVFFGSCNYLSYVARRPP